MKEVKIDIQAFRNIQNSLKGSLSKEKCRPQLGMFYIKVEDKKIQFQTCDGYSAIRQVIPIDNQETEPFEGFFPEIKLPKKLFGVITIKKLDNQLFIEYDEENTKTIKSFKQFYNHLDVDNIFEEKGDFEIHFKADLLCKTLKGFGSDIVTIFIPSDATKHIVIKEKNLGTEAVVLPVRSR